jgi:hypothetical protein
MEERRKGERRVGRIEVFWRESGGEAATNGQVVILSDDHGTVLTFNKDTFSEIMSEWKRVTDRANDS